MQVLILNRIIAPSMTTYTQNADNFLDRVQRITYVNIL